MLDFERRSARFHLDHDSYGGTMPRVRISESEPLPPLNHACRILVHSLYKSEPSKGELKIYWVTKSGVYLEWFGKADDHRLKDQYQKNKDVGERVVGLLLEAYEDRTKISSESSHPEVGTTETLPDDKIPEQLKEFVTQVETWQSFVNDHRDVVDHGISAAIQDGYYLMAIDAWGLKWWRDKETRDISFEGPIVLFPFDPKEEVPQIAEEEVHWVIEEKKIIVFIPHSHASDDVAKHYGYFDVLESFRKAKKTAQDEFRADVMAISRRRNEDARKVKAQITKQLLSS